MELKQTVVEWGVSRVRGGALEARSVDSPLDKLPGEGSRVERKFRAA